MNTVATTITTTTTATDTTNGYDMETTMGKLCSYNDEYRNYYNTPTTKNITATTNNYNSIYE